MAEDENRKMKSRRAQKEIDDLSPMKLNILKKKSE